MNASLHPFRYTVFTTIFVFALCAIPLHAVAVTAVPDTVSFSTTSDSEEIRLMHDGQSLPSESVRGVAAMINGNDYSYHFIIDRSRSGPATILIKPNPAMVEIGTFTLRIATTAGDAVATVLTPLDAMPNTLENRAKAAGLTVGQMKAQLGLVHPIGREQLTLQLPEAYPEGHMFQVSVPADSGAVFEWSVNGEVVQSGTDENTFQYVFTQPGENLIQMHETRNNATVASWAGTMSIVGSPALPWTVPVRSPIRLPGPEGFTKYAWSVNGQKVSDSSTLGYEFSASGAHTIECFATNPVQGNPKEYRRLVYAVTVR